VALRANHIHLRRRAQVLAIEGAVRIVAIGTPQQPLFHLVVKGHIELRLRVGVALIAKLWLRRCQQVLIHSAVVNAVTAQAAHIVFAVRRALEIRVLPLVATEASRIYFFRCGLGRIENLAYISAAIHMRFARSMAAFAGDPVLSVHLGQLGVRIRCKSFGNLFVARCAGILANEISRRRRRLAALCRGWVRRLPRSRYRNGRKQHHHTKPPKKRPQPPLDSQTRIHWHSR
jgi:hypothetical protein